MRLISKNNPDRHARDLDQRPQPMVNMGALERDLRQAGTDHHISAPSNPSEAVEYAPKSVRVAEAIMDGKEKLQAEVERTISLVRDVVVKEIEGMRKELDDLEAVVGKSFDAAKLALENQLNIAAQARISCNEMKDKIATFRGTVGNTLPKVEAPE